MVHCTFQRHHTSGKRARLREHGLWLADPPEYFQADALMTYGSDVREYIAALEAQASTPMAALFKHFHAMAYQLAQMRDAFAVARALNRTLVRLCNTRGHATATCSASVAPPRVPLAIYLANLLQRKTTCTH